ncbi:oxygenase MpaB family protein [Dyadobacter sp. CY312]|uniref:oxygenase MpaB family protein n=1 Tax=Dyadobacter sp. CY312 TaxID=2907303 RepID=UPI001F3A65F7|nr:oxygenase MpaB family protein [Dyadobacter sp. CY312]MCE7040834.1 DUF2236 domain-containing protein [Dyadobacter sp. CY312]
MKYFVKEGSVVREIWGKADTILFIFAGASAEFALNKAVDWLYFTGKLPADPLGRLFSTVAYARQIVFAEYDDALRSIDKIAAIHKGVEHSRGSRIPDWAYRDVLFMLIDYSIRSFEVLERKLTEKEKREIFETFYQVGFRMGIAGLPGNLHDWQIMRQEHLRDNMMASNFTADLYKQYRKHLGPVRYFMLKEVQVMVVPQKVITLLGLRTFSLLTPVLALYKLVRSLGIEKVFRNALLPQDYKHQVIELDQPELSVAG